MQLNKVGNSCVDAISKLKKVGSKVTNTIKAGILTDSVSFATKGLRPSFTQLSTSVDEKIMGKQCRLVSLPDGLKYDGEKFLCDFKVPTIAIVDLFGKKEQEKIANGIKISHGDIVAKYATKGLEDKVGVLAIDATPINGNQLASICDSLEQLVKIQKEFKNIDALNISIGIPKTFSELSSKIGKRFDSVNVESRQGEIIIHYGFSDSPFDGAISRAISAINDLVDNGVQVYSANGNMGETGIDLLSLSKAQHIVSSNDFQGATKVFANNFENAIYKFKSMYDETGNFLGITDGNIQLSKADLARGKTLPCPVESMIPKNFESTLLGTSFACPLRMNSDLLKKYS